MVQPLFQSACASTSSPCVSMRSGSPFELAGLVARQHRRGPTAAGGWFSSPGSRWGISVIEGGEIQKSRTIAPRCIPSHVASTSIWSDGPCGNSNDYEGNVDGHGTG